jgi:hypothetical protein
VIPAGVAKCITEEKELAISPGAQMADSGATKADSIPENEITRMINLHVWYLKVVNDKELSEDK